MNYQPPKELRTLVDRALDQTIDAQQLAHLEQLLQDEDALRYYLDLAGLDSALRNYAGSPLGQAMMGNQLPAPLSARLARFARSLRVPAAAAALLVTGLFIGKQIYAPEAPTFASSSSSTTAKKATDANTVAANITSMVGVRWNDGVPPKNIGLKASDPPIKWGAGLMEVTFASGVRALIEGPAELNVTGPNEAFMTNGRLVADVPKGAEGFTVHHSQGKVIDLGTEFAVNIHDELSPVEIGVFSGEVDVYAKNDATPVRVFENHAVLHGGKLNIPIESVPFFRDEYIRSVPSREFPWQFSTAEVTNDSEPTEMYFDVSHLVWRSGDYRAVVKWMSGLDVILIHQAELLVDGEVVASDTHQGSSGELHNTHNNTFEFYVPDQINLKGRQWELKLTVSPSRPSATKFSPDSKGIVLFEEGHAVNATADDFIGAWEYHHDNNVHQREFRPDGTVVYTYNGKETNLFSKARWSVDDGILTVIIPPAGTEKRKLIEHHILRNSDELIFIDRPYRNAKKVR
ncbi:FecR domain-containing protein [Sulfuriroseicoccus oceanibius]|uniref:Uncharacterized protein n=1 Tax=Sulfuriroseicoccus oceanibius TaxID=2707525 RepID=A0A6B3LCW1_9BACT|nr:FecR domain-containing protein [Sulfuriroseicoccus oceanibius]QQL44467.1 hypothetical protein G3M56_011310 [Sulfuriroseicoccus oceanibius]